MSTLHHEDILHDIYDQVMQDYYHAFNSGEITQDELESIALQRFEDSLI